MSIEATIKRIVEVGELEGSCLIKDLEAEIEALQARAASVAPIIKAVAYIGIDFGYGAYEMEQKHIDSARVLHENQPIPAIDGGSK